MQSTGSMVMTTHETREKQLAALPSGWALDTVNKPLLFLSSQFHHHSLRWFNWFLEAALSHHKIKKNGRNGEDEEPDREASRPTTLLLPKE